MIREFRSDKVPKPFESLETPAWKAPLAQGLPVDVEVGCGAGYHPIRYARENPDRYLIAIEHTRTRFSRFEGRLGHHAAMPNLLAVHADAIGWITHFLGEATVSRYFFLYPNPNHRWHAIPFMGRVLSTLLPGGTLTIATNLPGYAAEAQSLLTSEWGLRLASARELRQESLQAGFPRTHFEKKYLLRGQTCFDLVFMKP